MHILQRVIYNLAGTVFLLVSLYHRFPLGFQIQHLDLLSYTEFPLATAALTENRLQANLVHTALCELQISYAHSP